MFKQLSWQACDNVNIKQTKTFQNLHGTKYVFQMRYKPPSQIRDKHKLSKLKQDKTNNKNNNSFNYCYTTQSPVTYLSSLACLGELRELDLLKEIFNYVFIMHPSMFSSRGEISFVATAVHKRRARKPLTDFSLKLAFVYA